jgi:hypothetical protein
LSIQLEQRNLDVNKLKGILEQARKQFFEDEAKLKGDLRRKGEDMEKLKRSMEDAKLDLEQSHLVEMRRMEEEHSVTY